ncbi:hypothetical protein BSZ35_19195 [Salinibacter sp. 10B]|uniref:LA2681 family HEPN domain-containing protein n=1 Tax=Salinibacter sp. 10B TaxID=1923971 RepID=UPI000CF3AF93|nr:LA2681 family HEPN domain-containing protein [Salinibacter sp. 10B]PQJ26718.1 hypothetical protein BSZ35_19195 [Salinibacter sp. 10B]
MDPFKDAVPDQERQFASMLRRLLNREKYDKTASLAIERVEKGFSLPEAADALLKVELANILIDAGAEGRIADAIYRGIELYESNRKAIGQFVAETSIEYNLGNAKSGLYGVTVDRSSPRVGLEELSLLTEAKNHYWRALKVSRSDFQEHELMLHVNLGNALRDAGRIVEALQYYDEVLQEDPGFAKANGNRAWTLQRFSTVAGVSTNLALQVAEGYRKGASGRKVPSWVSEQWIQNAKRVEETLRERNVEIPDLEEDRRRTEEEFTNHSTYRQFSLRHFLSLSEHALYCSCAAAREDNLSVRTEALPMDAGFVPKMEHRLDRLKSEFSFARLSFFQSLGQNSKLFDVLDGEVEYTRSSDAGPVGLRAESLRMSFRTCFGILDKIAVGICELFNLPVEDGENINFHQSLWKPNSPRWEALNTIERNSFHAALYSQATDLSDKTDGEWAIYKKWRNVLEHGFLVLKETDEKPPGDLLESKMPVIAVPLGHFRSKTLHLLQLTRSAIFNFAYCARVEGWKAQKGVR